MVGTLVESGFQGRVLGMPNTRPNAILTGEEALAYLEADIKPALARYPVERRFTPVPTIQITRTTTWAIIRRAFDLRVRVGKVYPRYVTTNSENGVVDYEAEIYPALAEAQEVGMPVCFHGEHPSYGVPGRLKEMRFIIILKKIRRQFPSLKIVVEHVSTEAVVGWVRSEDVRYVRATITPQHLALTIDDLTGYSERSGGLVRVHVACKPVLKEPRDRFACRRAVVSGDPHFFYGGDDAPHLRAAKECGGAACGVFNTTVAIPFLIRLFTQYKALPKLDAFLSQHGAEFYGYPELTRKIVFARVPWTVPADYPVPTTGDAVVPLFTGEKMGYQLVA
jgi:dihydroorotase